MMSTKMYGLLFWGHPVVVLDSGLVSEFRSRRA